MSPIIVPITRVRSGYGELFPADISMAAVVSPNGGEIISDTIHWRGESFLGVLCSSDRVVTIELNYQNLANTAKIGTEVFGTHTGGGAFERFVIATMLPLTYFKIAIANASGFDATISLYVFNR